MAGGVGGVHEIKRTTLSRVEVGGFPLSGVHADLGALADGPILFEADMSYQIDNMEGLDVWRRDDGALMVSVVSDDNHSFLQRNLYLEFRLIGE